MFICGDLTMVFMSLYQSLKYYSFSKKDLILAFHVSDMMSDIYKDISPYYDIIIWLSLVPFSYNIVSVIILVLVNVLIYYYHAYTYMQLPPIHAHQLPLVHLYWNNQFVRCILMSFGSITASKVIDLMYSNGCYKNSLTYPFPYIDLFIYSFYSSFNICAIVLSCSC